MKKLILPITTLLFLTIPAESFTQEKWNVSAGISIPEGYNLGIRYKYKIDKRLDFFYGNSVPFDADNNWNYFSINHAIYFGKLNAKQNQKLWSINTGFLLGLTNERNSQNVNGFVNLYFAREIPNSKRMFIEPKLGASYLLFYRVNKGIINGYVIRIIPNFGLNLGIKL